MIVAVLTIAAVLYGKSSTAMAAKAPLADRRDTTTMFGWSPLEHKSTSLSHMVQTVWLLPMVRTVTLPYRGTRSALLEMQQRGTT